MVVVRRKLVSISVALTALASLVFAGSGNAVYDRFAEGRLVVEAEQSPVHATEREGSRIVDLKSDVGYQIDRPGEKIYVVVGNTAAHHNGAVITCDSAVRYSEKKLECFGNVLINKGTTYIYGDRALYNGDVNEASVFSDIVKVVDGTATLYTYNFKFNTQTNIGRYFGGGVVINEENLVESDRGYYYADLKEVICVDDVQMRNDTYEMTGDSVIYNVETNRARFFTNTNIWNSPEQEYLYADRGSFDRDSQLYILTRNGYVLTKEQEMWSDSVDYHRETGYILLRNDIQIDDSSQKVLALGDWGEYWKEREDAFLTREPVVISYDLSQGDTVYMRADSMFLYTRNPERDRAEEAARAAAADLAETEASAEADTPATSEPEKTDKKSDEKGDSAPRERADELKRKAEHANEAAKRGIEARRGDGKTPPADKSTEMDIPRSDSLQVQPDAESMAADSLAVDSLAVDSLAADSVAVNPLDTLTKAERKALLREQAKHLRDSIRKVKADSLAKKLDEIADRRQAKRTAMYRKMELADSMRGVKAKLRADERLRRSLARMARRGIVLVPADSTELAKVDSMFAADYPRDSIVERMLDSLIGLYFPKEARDSLPATDTVAVDSTYRLIQGYRNVRIYRSDFQAVCDSIVTSSVDSVIHMFVSPVLWNGANQITSEKMHITTRNQEIVRADFEGKPLTVSQIDTAHYNQVTGKEMSSLFRDNQIYRNDVNGNVQTIYYMQEEGSPEVTMMAYVESGDMTSYINEQQVTDIVYRGNPTYVFYPMDKIPDTQPLFLDGFKWEASRRPVRDSVLTRPLRESLRAVKETLKKPQFPISDALERRKARLIERKAWSDRTDTLTIETIEWLETLSDED